MRKDYGIGTLILLTSKQTMMIVILLLGCYTRTYTDCLVNPFSSIFLLFSYNFLLNEDDDDDGYDANLS